MYDERGHRLLIPSIYTFKYLMAAAAAATSELDAVDVFGFGVGLLAVASELKVSPFIALDKCSSIMIFPARPKSHSALSVYFPTGESLLM